MTTIAPPVPEDRLDPAFIKLAIVLITGVLAVVLDTTIVNVALDTLGRDLHAPVSTIQWVTTGFLLALGMAVPVTGWLVDRLGGKHVWMWALAAFLLGSIGSSLAWNAPSLIAFRVVQGVGGGLMLPVMQTLLIQALGGRSLGRATAMIALPALLGPVLGPVVGGLIVRHLGWQWIFWVNVPFCVVGLLLAWRLMPADPPGAGRARLDGVGLALLSPGIAAVIYGLARVGTAGGFGHPGVLVALLGGAALLVAFTVRALAADAPLVDVRLFRIGSFSASSALMFLSGFVLYGAMLLVPLYFQQVRGADALTAGLLIAPQGLGVLASRGIAGRLTDTVGARWVTFTGLVVTAIATVPFAYVGTDTSEWWLAAVLVVRGIGLGAVTIPVMASAYQGLDRGQVPHASIITRTAQQIGGSFGTAVLAVILERAVAAHAAGGAAGRATAFDIAFWWSVAFTAVAVVVSLWLPTRRPKPATG